jgi:hypothetical protein
MRAAIGLFAALTVMGGIASAESPGNVKTAGLHTPIPTIASDTLLQRVGVIKVTCDCKGSSKSITIDTEACPDGVKPSCDCNAKPPVANCSKARN